MSKTMLAIKEIAKEAATMTLGTVVPGTAPVMEVINAVVPRRGKVPRRGMDNVNAAINEVVRRETRDERREKEEDERRHDEFVYENSLRLHKDFPGLYPHPGPRPY
jgi:hypothetical protein